MCRELRALSCNILLYPYGTGNSSESEFNHVLKLIYATPQQCGADVAAPQ